ncbi:MAG: hypothetical protein H0X40_05130 [Chthoniobacterales bacterium]|nr:hypothetical protein [Chthoniobacterales bacterium]
MPLTFASIALSLTSCEPGGVETVRSSGGNAILLHKKLTQNQLSKLRTALHKDTGDPHVQREQLFHLREYIDGVPQTDFFEKGHLPDAYLLEENNEFSQTGFTGHAYQIGLGLNKSFDKVPPDPPVATTLTLHAHYQHQIDESQKLADEVDLILKGP